MASFFPHHCSPSHAAHRHWLCQDGEQLPCFDDAKPRLYTIAAALARPFPQSNELMRYWIEEDQFSNAVYTLYTFFGLEDPRIEIDSAQQPGSQAFRRWALDVEKLNSALSSDWPDWSDWIRAFEANLDSLKAYCQAVGVPIVDWHSIVWTQAFSARQTYGYRVRQVHNLDGMTDWDIFVDGLVNHPDRLTLANEWSRRLSRSGLLSELCMSGMFDERGILERPNPWEKDVEGILKFLSMQINSVSSTSTQPGGSLLSFTVRGSAIREE